MTLIAISDKIIGAGRDTDFLLPKQPQSRFEGLNRFSVSNRNVAFLLEVRMIKKICKICNKKFETYKNSKYCSRKCYYLSIEGKNHPRWKGGQTEKSGYIFMLQKEHPFANQKGYVRRSRLVMERHLGRYLSPEERMHHKGIKYPLVVFFRVFTHNIIISYFFLYVKHSFYLVLNFSHFSCKQ